MDTYSLNMYRIKYYLYVYLYTISKSQKKLVFLTSTNNFDHHPKYFEYYDRKD